MPAPPVPPECVGSGMQTESAGVSVVRVQTDISHVQVVRETTYASVATQAGAGGVLVGGDSVVGGVGDLMWALGQWLGRRGWLGRSPC